MINPFDVGSDWPISQENSVFPLVHIATGANVSVDVQEELLNMQETGKGILKSYIVGGTKNMKHHKLKYFASEGNNTEEEKYS